MTSLSETSSKSKNSSRIMKITMCVAILMIASVDIYIPAALIIRSEFQVSEFFIKLSFLTGPLFSFIFSIPAGYYSDRFGRRPFYLVSTIFFTLGAVISALASNFEWFFVGRIFLALSSGVISVLTGAILADLYRGITLAKYMGIYASLFPAVFTLAPIVGGQLLSHAGWRSIFWLLGGLMGILSVIGYYQLPETRKHLDAEESPAKSKKMFSQLFKLIKSPNVFALTIMNSLAISISGVFTINSPFIFMETYGFSPTWYSFFIALPVLCQFGGAILYRSLVSYIGPQKGLRYGYIPSILLMVGTFGFVTGLIPDHPYCIVGVVSLFTIGSSFIISSSVTLLLDAATNNKGLMNSVISLIRNGVLSIVLPGISYFVYDTVTPVFIAMFMIAFIIILLIYQFYAAKTISSE